MGSVNLVHHDTELADLTIRLIKKVRQHSPRVHCLTNTVAQPITANALLALGAVPSLTSDRDEMPDMIASADALIINLGTPEIDSATLHERAVETAESAHIPWVLDPVMVDRSARRLERAKRLLARSPDLVRCNYAEAEVLGLIYRPEAPLPHLIACTGATDVLYLKTRSITLESGHPMLSRITATGCALSAIAAAFLAIEREDPMIAVLAALTCYGVAGSVAAQTASGPGSLAVGVLDRLSTLTFGDISCHATHRETLS